MREQVTNREADAREVLEWAATAPRGDRAAVARALGIPPQTVSYLIRAAAWRRPPARVSRLAEYLRNRARGGEVEGVVVGAERPARLRGLALAVSARTGYDVATVQDALRARFPTVRNLFDDDEWVFARLADGLEDRHGDG